MKMERINIATKEAGDLLRRRRLEEVCKARPMRERLAEEINTDSNFSTTDWLEDIDSRVDAVTVELGHGYNPWIRNHPLPHQQVYIGVEARINPNFLIHPIITGWKWDEARVIKKIRTSRPKERAIFIDVDTGFDNERDKKKEPTNYNPESYLPDGLADQVIATNIIVDSRLHTDGRILKLLKEMGRLVKPGGKIVLHEDSLTLVSTEELKEVGLKAIHISFAQLDPEGFAQLHTYYGTTGRNPQATDAEYIMVLEKLDAEI